MEEYLSLDKRFSMPLSLSVHLLACPSCRKEVKALSKAEKRASKPLLSYKRADVAYIARLFAQKLKNSPVRIAKGKKRPLCPQIIAGLIFIATSFALIAFSSAHSALRFVCYLFIALTIILYCVSFVALNLDLFSKKRCKESPAVSVESAVRVESTVSTKEKP